MSANEDDGNYERDLFPTWDTIEGACNTREYVLRRDGAGVEVGADCYPTAGTWTSPYNGGEWTLPSDVDIDHMVPLKNAWIVRLPPHLSYPFPFPSLPFPIPAFSFFPSGKKR